MESNVDEILKPWIDAKQKAIGAEADENEKTRWQYLNAGLKKHQRQRFIDGEWDYRCKHAMVELESAVIACQRNNIPFEVTAEGVILKEPKEKWHSLGYKAEKDRIDANTKETYYLKVVEALSSIIKAIPHNEPAKVLDVTISIEGQRGKEYRNNEIRELLKEERNKLDEARREYKIARALVYLLTYGYVKE